MRHERGGVLIAVLILLGVLLVSAAALVRSSMTTTAISGNVAVKQAATQAADVGIVSAQNYLSALATPEVTVANVYYATQLGSDTYGLPVLNWTGIPVVSTPNGFKIQYVLERLCTAPLPVADFLTQCATATSEQSGSNNVGAPRYAGAIAIYYRATVRVTGPKNAESFIQAVFRK
jgi:type IV pilus assembly protein PilX